MVMTGQAPLSGCRSTREFFRTITAASSSGTVLVGLRRDLGEWLRDHARCDDAVIVADELVANALLHGCARGGRVTFVARTLRSGRVTIDVTDSGRIRGDAPCVKAPTFGHGLQVVERLCENVQIIQCGAGWHVETVLAARPPEIVEPDVDVEALLAASEDLGTDS